MDFILIGIIVLAFICILVYGKFIIKEDKFLKGQQGKNDKHIYQ